MKLSRPGILAVLGFGCLALALSACDQGVGWDATERQNAVYLFMSLESAGKAAQEANELGRDWEPGSEEVQPLLDHLEDAITRALLVEERVLIKAHPELPRRFGSEYLPALRALRSYYEVGDYRTPWHPADRLGDFTEWFFETQHEFRWWSGYEEDVGLTD